MLPTYHVYVRVYDRDSKRQGRQKGEVRYEARVAGTKNDAAMAANPHYRRFGPYVDTSMQNALKSARREFAASNPPVPSEEERRAGRPEELPQHGG